MIYIAKKKFTVVLALKDELKEVWNESGDTADGVLTQLINKQVMTNLKQNLVARMFTRPAASRIAKDDPGASMRLMPVKMMDMMRQAFDNPEEFDRSNSPAS